MGSDYDFSYSVHEHFTPLNNDEEFCVCCLVKNVPFVNLLTCKHMWFLDNFSDFKVELQVSLVCINCHNMLKKIIQFKQRVEDSFKWLNYQIPPEKNTFLPLSRTPIEVTYSSDFIVHEIKEEPTSEETESDTEFSKVKVKLESSESDYETELPLSEIKKEITVKKKTKKKTPKENLKKQKSHQKSEEKYDGKIISVTLTREELLEEREQERLKESYLKLPFKCDKCIIGFDHEANLKNHLEMRHVMKKGSFLCNICTSVLNSEGSYKEHCRRHLKRYECEACGVRYNTELAAVNHYNFNHEEIGASYTCDTCGYTTKSGRHFRYHKDTHKEKPVCALCGKSFINKTGLKKHILSIHQTIPSRYKCELCDKSYLSKSGLRTHFESAHSASKAFCAPCGKQFKCSATLHNHLLTHSRHRDDGKFKYTCDHCGSKFINKSRLQAHIDWIHLKCTKHQCRKCSKVFRTARNLQRHNEFVHEKKRLPRNKICDHCGRGFTTMSILTTHVRTHTGERPLRCAECGARFAHPAALYTHHKLLHKH